MKKLAESCKVLSDKSYLYCGHKYKELEWAEIHLIKEIWN